MKQSSTIWAARGLGLHWYGSAVGFSRLPRCAGVARTALSAACLLAEEARLSGSGSSKDAGCAALPQGLQHGLWLSSSVSPLPFSSSCRMKRSGWGGLSAATACSNSWKSFRTRLSWKYPSVSIAARWRLDRVVARLLPTAAAASEEAASADEKLTLTSRVLWSPGLAAATRCFLPSSFPGGAAGSIFTSMHSWPHGAGQTRCLPCEWCT
mmetsp:Transcript_50005/g.118972  ORF Transcript_50005/g.118972 Transcript_50005/m.118972 type:complete len:210 (+) Transcript_50005:720-1349(+)